MKVECDTCGQTGMLIDPGVPCLRRFADGTRVCSGTMVEVGEPQKIERRKPKRNKNDRA